MVVRTLCSSGTERGSLEEARGVDARDLPLDRRTTPAIATAEVIRNRLWIARRDVPKNGSRRYRGRPARNAMIARAWISAAAMNKYGAAPADATPACGAN